MIINKDPASAPPDSEYVRLRAGAVREHPVPLGQNPLFPSLSEPGPHSSAALGGWSRTENPSPVGSSVSWENSTVQQKLPSRKAGRPGGRGFSEGLGKRPGVSRLLPVFPHSGSALPGPPQEQLAAFGTSAGYAQSATLVTQDTARLYPRDPPPNTSTHTHLRPCCPSP